MWQVHCANCVEDMASLLHVLDIQNVNIFNKKKLGFHVLLMVVML